MSEQLGLAAVNSSKEALKAGSLAIEAEWITCPRGGGCNNADCVRAGGCDKLSVGIELPQAGSNRSPDLHLTVLPTECAISGLTLTISTSEAA